MHRINMQIEEDRHSQSSILGARVAERRRALGLSQQELGARVGLSQVSIKKIESGGQTRHSYALAQALGVPLSWLVGDADMEAESRAGENEPPITLLSGAKLGEAIRTAIDLKIEQGKAPSKAAIARHFGIQPPSLSGWVKTGAVSKENLAAIWDYFSDVVGPEHWGLRSQVDVAVRPSWPFKRISPTQITNLSEAKRQQLETMLEVILKGLEAHS